MNLDWSAQRDRPLAPADPRTERDIRMLQRADGVGGAAADAHAGEDQQHLRRARRAAEYLGVAVHAKLTWLKANGRPGHTLECVPSGMSALSAVTVAGPRTPRHTGAPPPLKALRRATANRSWFRRAAPPERKPAPRVAISQHSEQSALALHRSPGLICVGPPAIAGAVAQAPPFACSCRALPSPSSLPVVVFTKWSEAQAGHHTDTSVSAAATSGPSSSSCCTFIPVFWAFEQDRALHAQNMAQAAAPRHCGGLLKGLSRPTGRPVLAFLQRVLDLPQRPALAVRDDAHLGGGADKPLEGSLPLLRGRSQRTVRPLAGDGVVQRVVVANRADVALPLLLHVVRHGRHRLAARRARLRVRIEHCHWYPQPRTA